MVSESKKRLIDADDTMNQLRAYADRKHAAGHNELANGILKAVSYIRNNTVRVDAVEVVRCKDCKYSYYNKYCTNEQWKDNGATVTIEADDFCSYGEKRVPHV